MGDAQAEGELFHEIRKGSRLSKSGQRILGILLLLVVNLVWVGSAELTRYIFVDLHFKRPFFTTYVKSCMFTMFLLKSCINARKDGSTSTDSYSKLPESKEESEEDSTEESSFEIESLTPAEFEPAQLPSDSEIEKPSSPTVSISLFDENEENSSDGFGPFTEKDRFSPLPKIDKKAMKSVASKIREKTRRVKFAMFREVRRLPSSIAFEARLARLSYRKTEGLCEGCCEESNFMKYMFMFAPLVSFRNSYTLSELTGTGYGLLFSLISAVSYAAFLQTFSVMTGMKGKIDRSLMFGTIGMFSVMACTPLILVAHVTKLERQIPWPTLEEFLLILVNGLVGSIFADYLWIWATELTSSLISSLSLTLSIPLSFFADSLLRDQPPTLAQVIASIPIMMSFVGASLIQNKKKMKTKISNVKKNFKEERSELANLITDDTEL
ncbi:hypothetical protein FO519_006463 [Halicephalobus sp. NKZ332]|nr:hypothetical protein FO519_006463 [Halicephalobus sp. NKZ332]